VEILMSIQIESFYEKETGSLTHIVYDIETKDAIVIDPVLDYSAASSAISYTSIDLIIEFVQKQDLKLHYSLDTHIHADHLSGSDELKQRIPSLKSVINKNVCEVQKIFAPIYNLQNFATDGSQFDVLLSEDEDLIAGSIKIKPIFTPGHTPTCTCFLIEDCLFSGDALFMPDFGTGRCDFPAGNAKDLYHSVHEKLFKLPDATKIYVGHDYMPGGRELRFTSTISEQKEKNIHITASTREDEFVDFRTSRDEKLSTPKLLLPSIQININAGKLPAAENNEVSYLKIPITLKDK